MHDWKAQKNCLESRLGEKKLSKNATCHFHFSIFIFIFEKIYSGGHMFMDSDDLSIKSLITQLYKNKSIIKFGGPNAEFICYRIS